MASTSCSTTCRTPCTSRPTSPSSAGPARSIGLHALDLAAQWQIHLVADGFRWARHDLYAADENDCEVVASGTVTDLYLGLYGRPATLEVTGDDAVWARWLANSAL